MNVAGVNLSRDEVDFHPLSFFDENGRLFHWNGGLYRAVPPVREAFYRAAFEGGLIERLVERRLLIETEIAELTLDGAMVLKHRSLPLVSYPFEWCPEMLRDAALATLELERELEREGLMLQDAHPFNIIFDGSDPLWVDLGSFVSLPEQGSWGARDEFVGFFLNPLRLAAAGQGRLARWLLHDTFTGVRASEIEPFLRSSIWTSIRAGTGRAARAARARAPVQLRRAVRPLRKRVREMRLERQSHPAALGGQLLDELEGQLRALELTVPPGAWSDYYESFPSSALSADWTVKQATVDAVLRRVDPATVLDIGSNRGLYSVLAAGHGCSVAAIEADERSASDLYLQARSESLPVQVLLADFRQLSMGYGPGVNFIASVSERLPADLVLALALTHHLVFSYRMDFAQIVAALSAFTREALLVEFVPADDEYVRAWQPETRPWYTLDTFVAALRKEFVQVEVLPSHPEPRVLLLCVREL